jgi:glutamate/tyrosine decarboxylase-like PLP-dependent enzyme
MNPLSLQQSEYALVFEQITQLALDFLAQVDEMPSFPQTSGGEATALFDKPLPEQGMGIAALDDLKRVMACVRPPGPRFFGYVLGSGEPIAASADLIASVLNQNVTAWRGAPAAVTLEKVVVRWIAEGLGCAGFTGSLTGGGSSANLMALAMAREARLPANEHGITLRGAIYASTEVHMSIAKAAALLGVGRGSLRLIPCDENFRIRADLLRESIERDILADITPMAVVASAGTVSTGSIDPLAEVADIASEFGAWYHIDGAYGALAALAEPAMFAGLGRADSLSLDPHKWLYQPLDCGCLLYRNAAAARTAFSHSGDYAKSLIEDPVEGFVFFEESIELSRRFRALKLWLSLRYHGVEKFRDSIRNDLRNAGLLAELIPQHSELEVLAPAPLSAVCFRYLSTSGETGCDALNQQILQRIVRRGKVFLSNATLQGKFALRACFVNHRTTPDDVREIVNEVLAVGRELESGAKS